MTMLDVFHRLESVDTEKVVVDFVAQFARYCHQPGGLGLYLLLDFSTYGILITVSKRVAVFRSFLGKLRIQKQLTVSMPSIWD